MTSLIIAALLATGPVPSPPTNVVRVTTAPMRLFVEPDGGSDSNACVSAGSGACLTLQGAYEKIPVRVRHPVVISLGSGLISGGALRAREVDPATDAGAYVAIVGSLITFAAPDGGTASGTATSATACVEAAPPTVATLVDTTQSWVANQFQGYLVETTGGTGSGQFLPIASNTATTLTLGACWGTTPTAGTTYTVREWAANVNRGPPVPGDYLSNASTSSTAPFTFMSVNSERGSVATDGTVFIDSVAVNGAVNPLYIDGASLSVRRSRFSATTSGLTVQVKGNGARLNFQNSVATSGTGQTFLEIGPDQSSSTNPSTGSPVRILNSYFQTGATTVPGITVGMPGFSFIQSTLTMTSASAPNAIVFGGLAVSANVLDSHINCAAGGPIGISMNTTFNGTNLSSNESALEFSRSQVSGCLTSVSVAGPRSWFAALHTATFTAAGGTAGLNVSKGAHAMINNTVATTGSFTQEVLFEGAPTSFASIIGTSGVFSTTTGAAVITLP